MCGGKSLYCGCFGMPQTDSNDCCGCPPPPPCMPKCGRPPTCCRKGGNQSCKDNIVCYMPKPVCKHAQQQAPSCCKNRPPVLQCVKFPRAPGCMPMTCEPLPDCPNKFICRPINMHCPRTKTCMQPPPPPPRPVTLSCRSNCSSPATSRAASSLPPCPPPNHCTHKGKSSPSVTKCDSTTSREELKQKCDKQLEKKTPKS